MGADLVAVQQPAVRSYFTGAELGQVVQQMAAYALLDTTTPAPWAALKQGEQVLAARSPHPLQIPRFKFWTNDGWIVTSEECYLLCHRLRRCPDPLVQQFLNFAARCVSLGGFRVL